MNRQMSGYGGLESILEVLKATRKRFGFQTDHVFVWGLGCTGCRVGFRAKGSGISDQVQGLVSGFRVEGRWFGV